MDSGHSSEEEIAYISSEDDLSDDEQSPYSSSDEISVPTDNGNTSIGR